MAYVFTEPCIGTKDSACVPACPVEAIFALDEVPDKWKDYITKNTEYFKK